MIAAIDLGGTSIKVGLVKGETVLGQSVIEDIDTSQLGPNLSIIEDTVRSLCRNTQLDETEICQVGLAVPSIVDSKAGMVLSKYVKYQDFNELNLQHWARDQWQSSLKVENDARAALVGEWKFGAGKNLDNFVMVTLGTGMGTAAVVDGTLLRGRHFIAGNLGGHLSLNFHGNKCNCGSIGCVESEASTWALPEIAKSHEKYANSALVNKHIDFKLLFAEAEKDHVAGDVLDHCLKAWAFGVLNLVHAYDPEKVALSGGIMASGDKIIERINDVLNKYSWLPENTVKIEKAHRPNEAALLGMGYLCTNDL